MPAKRKPEAQTRTAQVSVRVDAQLYEKYKTKLKAEGISVTEDLETHMRAFIGEVMVQNNVVDITQVIEDVENVNYLHFSTSKCKLPSIKNFSIPLEFALRYC